MSLRRVEIQVIGFVQGVLFRQSAKEMAEKLGLTGFVKNEDDGSVEIIAEGEEDNLQKLVEWARLGTKWARVEKVEAGRKEAREEFKNFKIR